MKTIDTRRELPYSPLIPALKAFYTAPGGTLLEVVTGDASAFDDLKKFLSEQDIGFREIYEDGKMILQFTVPTDK